MDCLVTIREEGQELVLVFGSAVMLPQHCQLWMSQPMRPFCNSSKPQRRMEELEAELEKAILAIDGVVSYQVSGDRQMRLRHSNCIATWAERLGKIRAAVNAVYADAARNNFACAG